jgi:hypothetical protein
MSDFISEENTHSDYPAMLDPVLKSITIDDKD